MDVKLPHLGEGADSGVVVNLLVQEGDTVSADQTILELENEKAVAPIPSPAAGKITRVHVKEGDKISVGQKLITLEADAGSSDQAAAPAEKPEKTESPTKKSESPAREAAPRAPQAAAPAPAEGPEPDGGPSVRRIARLLDLDLRRVQTTGRGNRVTLDDLRNHVAWLQQQAFQTHSEGSSSDSPKATTTALPDFSQWGETARQPVSELRKVIGRRMGQNWNTVPHVTQFDSADVTDLNALRARHKEAYAQAGAKLTLTPIVLKALADTLKAHPLFNASLDEAAGELVLKHYIHIGIAVDTEAGLIVPVVRDVDRKSVLDIAKELDDLALRTRERKVKGEELKGGTFTLSNQGAIGGGHFTPIVNHPEVAILGIGRSRLEPVVGQDETIQARLRMPLAVSYDHRVIDGGAAARFVTDLVRALETFPEAALQLAKP